MAAEQVVWDNWERIISGATPTSLDQGDTRLGHYCRDDKQDLLAYSNYIKICSLIRRRAAVGSEASHGSGIVTGASYMFDLGFIPITMTPSYWDPKFAEDMYRAVQAARLPLYSRNPVGLSYYVFNSRKNGSQPEWWASKLDVAERLGIAPDNITIKEVYSVCGLALH